MKYQFNEGSLIFPESAINKTVHMLVLNPETSLTCSMIVSGFLEGETPEQFVDRQMKSLSRQLTQFKEVSRTKTDLKKDNEHIETYLIETQFKQGAQPFFQKQCVALISKEKALVFTINSNQPFSEGDLAAWTVACNSLEFRKNLSA